MKALTNVLTAVLEFCENKADTFGFEGFDAKAAQGKWSKKEIIGHLVDSAYNNHRRYLLAPDMEAYFFEGYNQNQWVIRNGYQQKDAKDLFRFLIAINRHFLELLEGMSFDLLTQKTPKHNFHVVGMLPVMEGESKSLSYFFYDYLYHMEHHLKQIFLDYQVKLNPINSYKCI
jgi:hypothetical protein